MYLVRPRGKVIWKLPSIPKNYFYNTCFGYFKKSKTEHFEGTFAIFWCVTLNNCVKYVYYTFLGRWLKKNGNSETLKICLAFLFIILNNSIKSFSYRFFESLNDGSETQKWCLPSLKGKTAPLQPYASISRLRYKFELFLWNVYSPI